jgi:hypothetical protein
VGGQDSGVKNRHPSGAKTLMKPQKQNPMQTSNSHLSSPASADKSSAAVHLTHTGADRGQSERLHPGHQRTATT